MGAAFSSDSVNTQEMSISVPVGGEAHIAQQTASDGSEFNEKKTVIFDENGTNFKEAVKWSGYVDKTLLIAELLRKSKSRRVIMCVPKRFGKTLNMDMIKCFFEIEEGRDISHAPQDLAELKKFEKFQAFCRYGQAPPCKIMNKTDIVKEYFGRHPVVHVDFKNVRGSSIRDVKDDIRTLIHKAYLEHSYLKIFEQAKETCEIWCDEMEYKKRSAALGLEELIEYLHVYHKRKVYLLIDNFDAPVVNALLEGKSGGELKNISDEITLFLGAALKGNIADKHLLGSLITGVSYFGGNFGFLSDDDYYDDNNNVEVYKWLCKWRGRFVDYYGLGDNELTQLLENVFPGEEQKVRLLREEVVDIHNRHYFKKKSVYCLWSVLHYIGFHSTLKASEIIEKTFWGGFTIINKMAKLLTRSEFMPEIMDLISERAWCCEDDRLNIRILGDALNGEKDETYETVFLFLLDQGCLTHTSDGAHGTHSRVKIFNPDILVTLQEMFRDYFINISGVDPLIMKRCAEIFKAMSIRMPTDDGEFNKILQDIHFHLKTFLSKFKGHSNLNKYLIQAAVYTSMIEANFRECCTKKSIIKTENWGKTDIIDLWMLDDDFAVIWKFKYSSNEEGGRVSVKESSRQACSEILFGAKFRKIPYIKVLEQYPNKIKNYLLIGLSMDSECEPYMCCLLNNQELENCIFFPEE